MKLKWMVAVILGAGLAGTMHASPLVYTWVLPGIGTLDGVNFSVPHPDYPYLPYNIRFTTLADSSSVVQTSPGGFEVTGPTTVTVDGVGSDTITDTIYIAQSYGGVTYLFDDATTGSGWNITILSSCFSYAQCQPVDYLAGPLSGQSGPGLQAGGSFNTGKGTLVFTAPSIYMYSSPDFSITAGTTAVTPEPSSLVLLGSGLVGLVGVLRRRWS